jgi:hypothetical protein
LFRLFKRGFVSSRCFGFVRKSFALKPPFFLSLPTLPTPNLILYAALFSFLTG